MKVFFSHHEKQYSAKLDSGMDISIRLNAWPEQPNAFHAPPFEAVPYKSGEFVGSLAAGAPVNFFNLRMNPHGNGTHTECARHILDLPWPVAQSVISAFYLADLVSVYPELQPNGDKCISRMALESLLGDSTGAKALIVRTMPNPGTKQTRKYSGTNPPYFLPGAMQWVRDRGYRHLLTDLPSVDREEDEGKLTAHHIFWETDKKVRSDKTITEMIFVNDNIGDGLYLLNIQVLNLDLDASPSRPLLFEIEEENTR